MNIKILGSAAALTAATVAAGGVYLSMPAAATPAAASARTGSSADGDGKAEKQRKGDGKHRLGPRRKLRGLHGEVTVRRKGEFVRVGFQRGQVTESSGGTITLRSLDGVTLRWTTDAETRVRRHGDKSEAAKVAKGDWAFVAGAAENRQAKLVVVPKKAPKAAKGKDAPSAN